MLVNQMAVFVGKKLARIVEKPEEEEILAYGAEVILGSLVKLVALIIFGAWLGKLSYIFTVAFTTGSFRLLSGGVHFSTYYRCLFFTVVTFIGLGLLSEKLAQVDINSFIFGGVIFLFSVLVILLWVPGSSENRVVENKERRFRFKLYSICFVGSVYAFIFFANFQFNKDIILPFVYAILLGLLWQAFTVTPWGYGLFQGVDKFLDHLNTKGGFRGVKKIS